MKKVIVGLMSIITLSVVSCSNDDTPKQKGLNPYDTAIVKAESKTKSVIFDDLTSYQDSIDAIFKGEKFAVTLTRFGQTGGTDLGEEEVNKEKQEFTLRNLWVVDQNIENGPYVLGQLPDLEELIFLRWHTDGHNNLYDTVAYVPRNILIETGKKVKAAFAEENYDECRRLLQNEYKFKPIDAAGYEALKAGWEE